MQFTALLASTMLIVLISVYSTSTLPLNETEVEHSHEDEMTAFPSSTTKRVYSKKMPVSGEKICQEGTKANKDGVCEPVESMSNDDSEAADWCPENYARVDSSCLYIKPKQTDSMRKNKHMTDSAKLLKPRLGNKETTVVENIPVRPDNSCPEGTEYSEHGVCQKRVSAMDIKPQTEECPEHTELVQGQCLPMKMKIPVKVVSSSTMGTPMKTSKHSKFESTTEMFIEATTVAEHPIESEMETTAHSVTEQAIASEMETTAHSITQEVMEPEMETTAHSITEEAMKPLMETTAQSVTKQ